MWRVLSVSASYRRMFLAQVVALAGTGLATVALGLLAYDLAAGAAGRVLATALTIKMAAYVAAGPVLTALTARLPRRAVLVGADIVRASAVACLPWVEQVWQVYVLIAVLQAASATFTPAFQALIPELVEDADYTSALALSRLAYDLEALASPLLAAALLVLMPFGWLFAATAAGFAVSAVLVATTSLPAAATVQAALRRASVSAGWRVFATDARLRALLLLNLAVAAATSLVLVDSVVFVRADLGGTETALALVLACFGGGSMAVALVLRQLVRRVGVRRLMLAGPVTAATGLAVLAVGWAPAPGVVLLGGGWLVLGAACSLVSAPTGALLRSAAPEGALPGVFAAQFSLSHACFLLTYPLAGWAGARLDPATVFLAVAAVIGACAVTAPLLWRARSSAGTQVGADGVAWSR